MCNSDVKRPEGLPPKALSISDAGPSLGLSRYQTGSPEPRTKDASLTSFPNPGSDMLMVQRQEKCVNEPNLNHRVSGSKRRASINPVLKAWIDNIIVPALVDQWAAHQASRKGHA